MTGSIAAVVFLTLIACLVLTVPIGFSLGIASLGYILYTKQLTFGFIAQNMVTGCDSFPTMAIPFFIFAGELMGGGGISKRLLNLANVFFGRIQGGLAIVTVVVCMFFAAISGSGPATVAAVGGMVIPTMLEKGYDKKTGKMLVCVNPKWYRPTDVVNLWGDPTKAKTKLGWNPQKTTFEQLVKIMVDADMAKVAVERAGEHVRTNLEEYLEKGIVK